MIRVQCQRGTDEINHGTQKFTVSNISWQVSLPDEIANFMIADGRAGIVLIGPEPDPEDETTSTCPHCGHFFKKE